MNKILLVLFCLVSLQSLGQGRKIRYENNNAGNRYQRGPCSNCIQQKPNDTLPIFLGLDTAMVIDLAPAKDTEGNQTVVGEMELVDKQALGNLIAVYPNPTVGDLFITLENFGEITTCDIEIKDINGRQIYFTSALQALYSFSLAGYPSGTYFVRLTVNDKRGYYTVIKE